MNDLNSSSSEERFKNLQATMEAFDHKLRLLIVKLQAMSEGKVDKDLLMDIDTLASQKKRQTEQEAENAAASGGGGGHVSKEFVDKLNQQKHSLDEMKKSYFKKMKEID